MQPSCLTGIQGMLAGIRGAASPVRPGDGHVLVPPAGGREGDVEAQHEGQRDHLHEGGAVVHQQLEHPARPAGLPLVPRDDDTCSTETYSPCTITHSLFPPTTINTDFIHKHTNLRFMCACVRCVCVFVCVCVRVHAFNCVLEVYHLLCYASKSAEMHTEGAKLNFSSTSSAGKIRYTDDSCPSFTPSSELLPTSALVCCAIVVES